MTLYWNPDYAERASNRYTTIRFVVILFYLILAKTETGNKGNLQKNKIRLSENTSGSLVLKSLFISAATRKVAASD